MTLFTGGCHFESCAVTGLICGTRRITNLQMQSVFIVAEIAQAHDGSLGILHSMVDAAVAAGVDAVKFQMHIAESESSVHDEFRVRFSPVDRSRFDYWQRMELSCEQWADLKARCEAGGCEFMCTPFSVAAVRRLEKLGIKRYKIGSGDTGNLLLLDEVGRTGKPVILSSGMSSFQELDVAIRLLQSYGCDVSVMQCTSNYPVAPPDWGLNVIQDLARRYGLPVGLSDHSGTVFPGLAAVALGASLLEVHVTFDRRMFGPDASSSLDFDELGELVRGARMIRTSLDHPVDKTCTERFERMRVLFGRSLTAGRDIALGETIQREDLEAAKPMGHGMRTECFGSVVGRRVRRAIPRFDFIKEDDLE
jgi:N,N'-diacetyllegionaminate synthase